MNNEEKELIISYKKVIANIKRCWWILLFVIASGILISTILTWNNFQNTNITQTNNTNTGSLLTNQYFGAETLLVKSVDYSEDLIKDCESTELVGISEAYAIKKKLNEALIADDYTKLESSDVISALASGKNIVTISVYGTDKSRVSYIADKLAELLILYVSDNLKVNDWQVLEKAEPYLAIKNANGSFTRDYKEINESKNKLDTQSEINDSNSDLLKEKNKFSITTIFKGKGALIIIASICLAILVFFVALVNDKNVYVKEDLQELRYLGCVSKNCLDETAMSISIGLKKKSIKNIGVIARTHNDGMSAFIDFMKKYNEENIINLNLSNNDGAMEAKLLDDVENVIIYVNLGTDKKKSIRHLAEIIDVAGYNILGYVLSE